MCNVPQQLTVTNTGWASNPGFMQTICMQIICAHTLERENDSEVSSVMLHSETVALNVVPDDDEPTLKSRTALCS